MGANTYRLMYGFQFEAEASASDLTTEQVGIDQLAAVPKWCSTRRWMGRCRGPTPVS